MNETMKEILLKQVELIREACKVEMPMTDAVRLSEALASALSVASRCNYIPELLRKRLDVGECDHEGI